MIVWTHAVFGVLNAYVLYFCVYKSDNVLCCVGPACVWADVCGPCVCGG